jgi:putative ABC transport system substrate-binding protein
MQRRQVLSALGAVAMATLATGGSSAQAARPAVIGLLDAGERLDWWNALRQQLREMGYVEGRDVRYEPRYAKGKLDALDALAKELVALKVAVIVTGGSAAAVAARRVTRTVPIVSASGADPVALGLAGTLAQPGGNVTGLVSLNADLMAKRFELLREVVPGTSRMAVLWHADNASSSASVRDLSSAAAKARLPFRSFGIRTSDEVTEAFAAMARDRVDAVFIVNSPYIFGERRRVAELAIRQRLPTMCGAAEYVEAGGLLSYAASYPALYRRAAVYVDRILKGARPADLPIEQPSTFELVVNAKTARAIGLTIPAPIMARADRVVD